MDLYNELDGENWSQNQFWNTSIPYGFWEGVDGDNYQLTELFVIYLILKRKKRKKKKEKRKRKKEKGKRKKEKGKRKKEKGKRKKEKGKRKKKLEKGKKKKEKRKKN